MADQRVAIITGAGKGIGQGIARRLAADGMIVIANYLKDRAAAEQTLAQIKNHSPRSIIFQADVATPEGAKKIIEDTLAEFQRLDILVNNVGPFLVKSLVDTEPDEWRRMIDGNLSSAFYCCKYAIPIMRAQKNGIIINLGSLNAENTRGAPTTTAYNIAKTGLVVLSKSIARSEGRYGIRCNLVNPGYIETDATTETDRRELPSLIPLGSLGSVDDIAQAVAYLISPQARYITGAVLNVHGGLWV
ncbi:MAG: SDR family oxidoreductase [Chloroflexi bacterium]|nr:SDR family oxidoreductase [Chloroflexota bacterium]